MKNSISFSFKNWNIFEQFKIGSQIHLKKLDLFNRNNLWNLSQAKLTSI